MNLKKKKELSQPIRVKTGGSTFKNPINQENKKVWELIRESIDIQKANRMFGDATLSEKHCIQRYEKSYQFYQRKCI